MVQKSSKVSNLKIYEALVLLNPDFAGKDEAASSKHVQGIIEKSGGEVIRVERYADQKLAYEIKGFKRGVYVLVAFRMKPADVTTLARNLRYDDHVLRDLVLDRTGLTVDKFFRHYERTAETEAEIAAARAEAQGIGERD